MKLEQQLTPLPQARRLDELGFKGESYYVWVEGGKLSDPVKRAEIHPKEVMDNRVCLADAAYRLFPAYSVPELMDALPTRVIIEDVPRCIDVGKNNDGTYYVDLGNYSKWWGAYFENTNFAEALSDMLIRLIENGLYIVNKE